MDVSILVAQLNMYEYTPLTQLNSTRLLWVEPAPTVHSPLSCQITEASLDAGFAYGALSYTWGPPIFDQVILLNERPFMITANLSMALRRFRRLSARVLWVDALCINQADNEERSKQVLLMKRIYAQAKNVFVYLGEGTDRVREVLLPAMGQIFTRFAELIEQDNSIEVAIAIIRKDSHTSLINSSVLRALLEISQCPWFSRAWIIQEASNGSITTKALFGDSMFDFVELLILFLIVPQILPDNNAPFTPYTDIYMVADKTAVHLWALLMQERNRNVGIVRAVTAYRFLNASDPRDKIYAFLGIAREHISIVPNYAAPVAKVYHDFARAMIQSDDRDDRLIFTKAGVWRASLELPSWVPDWSLHHTSTDFTSSILQNTLSRHRTEYNAGGTSEAVVSLDDSETLLVVQGCLVDSIAQVGPELKASDPMSWRVEFLEWDRASRALLGFQDDTVETPRLVAYNRTIFGGLGNFSKEVFSKDLSETAREVREPSAMLPIDIATQPNGSNVQSYLAAVREIISHRRFAVTQGGLMALVPGCTTEGDQVAIFLGVRAPFVVRLNDCAYTLVGDAYVDGLMEGEALQRDDFTSDEIVLS